MPWSVSRSRSRSAALATWPVLVESGRFIGADTALALIERIFIFRSFSFEAGLALLHERAPAFLVVRACRAALHRRLHALGIGRTERLGVLLDDGLGVGDRERGVLAQRLHHVADEGLQIRIGQHALHETD